MLVSLKRAGCGLKSVALKRTGCDVCQLECQASKVTASAQGDQAPSARIHASSQFRQ